jgi:hypothetical protein
MEVPRMGSSVSAKAMARAAVEGKRIIFNITGDWAVCGYLVGMDDFHWIVAEVGSSDSPEISLVHKTIPVVTFTAVTLEKETEEFRQNVKKIGQSFWDNCKKQYLGRNS